MQQHNISVCKLLYILHIHPYPSCALWRVLTYLYFHFLFYISMTSIIYLVCSLFVVHIPSISNSTSDSSDSSSTTGGSSTSGCVGGCGHDFESALASPPKGHFLFKKKRTNNELVHTYVDISVCVVSSYTHTHTNILPRSLLLTLRPAFGIRLLELCHPTSQWIFWRNPIVAY